MDISIRSRLNSGCVFRVSAYVLDKLTAYLPARVASVTAWPELEQLTLADPEYHTPNKIDVLLGAEVFTTIIDNGVIKCPSGSLVAQNTTLGWVLSGKINTKEADSHQIITMHAQVESVEQLLRSFWEVEAEPCNNQKMSPLRSKDVKSYLIPRPLETKKDDTLSDFLFEMNNQLVQMDNPGG